jgi:succinate dehydrogenase / fumarate reductase membrane anchor subunit
MIEEQPVQQAAARAGRRNDLFEQYARYFMRLSGLILMILAVFHLIYMQFIIPGGVAGIDYEVVVARWTDPGWGIFWRTFDILLLTFGLTHGSNGIRTIIDVYINQDDRRVMAKTVLYFIYFILMVMGLTIVFSFR